MCLFQVAVCWRISQDRLWSTVLTCSVWTRMICVSASQPGSCLLQQGAPKEQLSSKNKRYLRVTVWNSFCKCLSEASVVYWQLHSDYWDVFVVQEDEIKSWHWIKPFSWSHYKEYLVVADRELHRDSSKSLTPVNSERGTQSHKCRWFFDYFAVILHDWMQCSIDTPPLVVKGCLSDGARFDRLIFQESQMLAWPGSVFST